MKGRQHTIPRCVLAQGERRIVEDAMHLAVCAALDKPATGRAFPLFKNNATVPTNSSLISVLRCKFARCDLQTPRERS
jgi:hypothetical protein